MKKSRYTEEQIIGILKQHEAGVKTAERVNVKRIYRLYTEAGLAVRRRRRKRLVRDSLASARLTRPNQEWAGPHR